jgi:hypothetical protein
MQIIVYNKATLSIFVRYDNQFACYIRQETTGKDHNTHILTSCKIILYLF